MRTGIIFPRVAVDGRLAAAADVALEYRDPPVQGSLDAVDGTAGGVLGAARYLEAPVNGSINSEPPLPAAVDAGWYLEAPV